MSVRLRWRDVRVGSLDSPVGMARSKRYLKSPPGHNSGSTRNVWTGFLSCRSHDLLIPSTAVVLANVLGFFNPVRALIQDAIRDGFIQPAGINLVKFVDGPSDYALHESFDWGGALIEELESWEDNPSYRLGFDWTRPRNGKRTEALSAT